MSRSWYVQDDGWEMHLWRGTVASATRGRRGQLFFRDLLSALDAMPENVLIADELQDAEGSVCAIGALGVARGIDMKTLDPEVPEDVGKAFDIATCLAQEVVFMNDEDGERGETPAQRWARMRAWVAKQIREEGGVECLTI